MKPIRFTMLLLSFVLSTAGISQDNTVGLLSYVPEESFDGYNLIYPHNQPNVYLLDNCGEIVHVWTDEDNWRPGNTAYIRADGSLVKTKRDVSVVDEPIFAGGAGAIIEIRSWENDLLWTFEMNDEDNRLHHDIEPLDNGNILAIAWEYKTEMDCLQAGRDTANTATDELWPDWILEIDPDTDEIVWEWHAWDHLIQDIDSERDNFGDVGADFRKIDVNFDTHEGDRDWLHMNSIDYNETFQMILLSVPYFNEIWIIDHTTTTAEAAGSTGGLSGNGGDLMFRWGNDTTFRAGTSEDQKLFFQHDASWGLDFLSPGDPNYNRLSVFNNRVGEDFSSAGFITNNFDGYDGGFFMQAGVFLPSDFSETITHPVPTEMHSTGLSSTQALPNGNTLIHSGRQGYAFEITQDGEIVWEYVVPIVSGERATQGDVLDINNNLTFRMTRYPTDYMAFQNVDLSPIGWIELEPDMEFCDEILTVDDLQISSLTIYPNPARDLLYIRGLEERSSILLHDLSGRLVLEAQVNAVNGRLDISGLSEGTYILSAPGSTGRVIHIAH